MSVRFGLKQGLNSPKLVISLDKILVQIGSLSHFCPKLTSLQGIQRFCLLQVRDEGEFIKEKIGKLRMLF